MPTLAVGMRERRARPKHAHGKRGHGTVRTVFMQTHLQVGAGAAEITPDRPLPNYNGQVIERGARTLPLKVSAIVCRADEAACAIVSVDATFLDRPFVEKMRARIAARTGIEAANVLIAATHSHAAPATCPSFLSGALPDGDYLNLIVERAGQAAQQAAGGLEPVRYASGVIASPLGWCRRWVDGAGQAHFMPEVPLQPGWKPESEAPLRVRYLVFENAAGQAVAAAINVPCHNNFVFEAYHADFFGWAGNYLRERLSPGLIVAALPAPCGDIACRRPDEFGFPGDPFQLAEAAGRSLGQRILDDLRKAERKTAAKIVCRSVREKIPDRAYADSDFCHDDCRGESADVRDRIRRRYDPEEAAVRKRGATACEIELQCIALGDTAIVSNPAELFSAYDERIQAGSPFAVTLVSELSNGYCGYVPTPEAFSHGCYETHRTVLTSRLAKDGGERICQMSLDLLRESLIEDRKMEDKKMGGTKM
jgi:neutral ceramidase